MSFTTHRQATAGYRSREVARILGISRRQLQYWVAMDLVRPAVRTRGGTYRYTFQDLVALRAAKKLIDAGVSVQRIRRSIEALQRMLPSVRRPLAELQLVGTANAVLVVRDGTAFEAISGQKWVLEVAALQEELADLDALVAERGGATRRDVSRTN